MEPGEAVDEISVLLGEISNVTNGESFGHGPSRQSISPNSPRAAEIGDGIPLPFNWRSTSAECLAAEFEDMSLNGAGPISVSGSICGENAVSYPSSHIPRTRPESVADDHQLWQRLQGSSASSMNPNGGINNFFESRPSVLAPGLEVPSSSSLQHHHHLVNALFPGYIPHCQQRQLDRQFWHLEHQRCYRNYPQQLQDQYLRGHVLGLGNPALELDLIMVISQQHQASQVNPFRPSLQGNGLGRSLHGNSGLSMRNLFMDEPTISRRSSFTSGLIDSIIQKLDNLELGPDGLSFTEESQKIVNEIFNSVISNVFELMSTPAGSHLIEKLVEVCNEEELTCIVQEISANSSRFFRLACDQIGTHVVRSIIKAVKSHRHYYLISSSLKSHLLPLIKDANGSSVAELCLQCLPPDYRESFLGPALVRCAELAKDKRGCCFLQRYMRVLDGNSKIMLISIIASKACELSQDPYGNYVVQFILEQDIEWATGSIVDQLEGHYRALSVQKHSSNVVERLMTFAGVDGKYKIIRELIRDPPYLLEIAQNQYGNYVIQSALVECNAEAPLRAALLKALKPYIPQLGSNPYGRKVLQRMKRRSTYLGNGVN